MKRFATKRTLGLWKKLAFTVVAAVACLSLLELVLLLFGVRPVIETRDPFVGFSSKLPLYVDLAGSEGRRLTTAGNKLEYFNRQTFSKSKPTGTYRIFCLGGSTTFGRPYDDVASFPGWIRELLPVADRTTRWEVINAGGISYASYRVAELMQELIQYGPDLFIVYTGHNEFLEHREYGDIRVASEARKRLTIGLAKTRTYAAVDAIVRSVRGIGPNRFQMSSEVDAMLDHSSGPSNYTRDDKLRDQILRHFQFNLDRMVRIARGGGADILFVVPACNLKEFSPFKNDYADGLTTADLQEFESLLEEGERYEQGREFRKALNAYDKAQLIDDRYAELYFRAGRALLALERESEARVAFLRAVDEDVCPLRAPSQFTDTIRELATQLEVPLVDFELLLKMDCLDKHGHGAPGDEYFMDHVHPNLATNRLLAVEIVNRLIDVGVVAKSTAWNDTAIDRVASQIESMIDDQARAVALRNLAEVLMWAGKIREGGQRAVEALAVLPGDAEALYYAGAYLKMLGDSDRVKSEFHRFLDRYPRADEADRLLAAAYVAADRHNTALEEYRHAFQLDPTDPEPRNMLGAILSELGQDEEAVAHYRLALQSSPNAPDLRYRLANALRKLGHRSEAVKELEAAIQLNDADADSMYELGVLLAEECRFAEAILYFRRALEVRPGMSPVSQQLAEAQRRQNALQDSAARDHPPAEQPGHPPDS